MYGTGTFPACFLAGATGDWTVERLTAVSGESLPLAPRLEVCAVDPGARDAAWSLRGVAGHAR